MTPATVRLRLHDDGRETEVDLGRLSARARALAECVAQAPLRTRHPVILESDRTLRDLGADPLWHGPDLDRPHRLVWNGWAFEGPADPHAYLEREAAKLPLGYTPVGWSHEPVPSAGAARDEADLIPKAQVLELLAALGRPITAGTFDNYRSSPAAGWPQPARYVGRTPLWSRADVEAYAAAGRRVEAALATVTEVVDLGAEDAANLAEALRQVAAGETAVFASVEEFDADLRARAEAVQ